VECHRHRQGFKRRFELSLPHLFDILKRKMKFCIIQESTFCLPLFTQLLFPFWFLSIYMVYIFLRSLLCPNLSLLYIWLTHSLHYIPATSFRSTNIHNILLMDFPLMLLLLLPIHILLLISLSISVIFFRSFVLHSVFCVLLIRNSLSNDCYS